MTNEFMNLTIDVEDKDDGGKVLLIEYDDDELAEGPFQAVKLTDEVREKLADVVSMVRKQIREGMH